MRREAAVRKIVALWVSKINEADETVADILDDLAAEEGVDPDEGDLVDEDGGFDKYEAMILSVNREARIRFILELSREPGRNDPTPDEVREYLRSRE